MTDYITLLLPRSLLAHPGLPASAKLIYAVLQSRKAVDGTARVGKTWLAVQVGLDRRQIHTLLRTLEGHGLIEIHRDDSEPHYYRFPDADAA